MTMSFNNVDEGHETCSSHTVSELNPAPRREMQARNAAGNMS